MAFRKIKIKVSLTEFLKRRRVGHGWTRWSLEEISLTFLIGFEPTQECVGGRARVLLTGVQGGEHVCCSLCCHLTLNTEQQCAVDSQHVQGSSYQIQATTHHTGRYRPLLTIQVDTDHYSPNRQIQVTTHHTGRYRSLLTKHIDTDHYSVRSTHHTGGYRPLLTIQVDPDHYSPHRQIQNTTHHTGRYRTLLTILAEQTTTHHTGKYRPLLTTHVDTGHYSLHMQILYG